MKTKKSPNGSPASLYLDPQQNLAVSLCGSGSCFWYVLRTPQAVLLQSREFQKYQDMRREVAAVLRAVQKNEFAVEDVDDGKSQVKSLVINVKASKPPGRWNVVSHHGPVASVPSVTIPAKQGDAIEFYPDRVIVDGNRYLVEEIVRSPVGLDVYRVAKELKRA